MATEIAQTQNARFKIGWWIMAGLAAVSLIGHLSLLIIESEPVLFLGWALYALYALVILLFPFRQGQRWAWYSIWIWVAGYASLILFDSQVGIYYLILSALIALCLFLTYPAFSRS